MQRAVVWVIVLVALVAAGGANTALAQEGRAITYGDVVNATITDQAYRYVYYFSARQGDVIALRMTPLGGDLDALLLLTDNNGHVLARSDDAQADLSASINPVQIPADDYYFIIATRFGHALGSTAGEFELALQRIGIAAGAGVFLAYGDSVIGEIDDTTYQVTYTFEAGRGDIVNVQMLRLSGNLDPYLTIANASGQILADNDDRDASLNAEIKDLLILDAGRYA
ncbi:MAG: hypothetical protein JW910_23335, partial [Anaerolineae bacterium]|nr:hypothetical protein [Anaerolineae bacterium]